MSDLLVGNWSVTYRGISTGQAGQTIDRGGGGFWKESSSKFKIGIWLLWNYSSSLPGGKLVRREESRMMKITCPMRMIR